MCHVVVLCCVVKRAVGGESSRVGGESSRVGGEVNGLGDQTSKVFSRETRRCVEKAMR